MTRTPIQVQRRSVVINRVPITILSDTGHKRLSGMFLFENPSGHPDLSEAVCRRLTRVRDLWCPYCAEHHEFVQDKEVTDVWKCSGGCNMTTNDFYIRFTNNLWWDGVPFDKVKELSRLRFR